jgi:hypothetical protein
MIVSIPIDPSKRLQTFDVELDGSTYRIDLIYNHRVDQWFMNLAFRRETTVVPILTGAGLSALYPTLAGTQHPDRPGGELMPYGVVDPGRYDLGTKTLLLYFPKVDLGRA